MVSAVKMYSRDKLDYNVPAKYFTYMKEKSELLCSKNMHPFYFAVGILSSLEINREFKQIATATSSTAAGSKKAPK